MYSAVNNIEGKICGTILPLSYLSLMYVRELKRWNLQCPPVQYDRDQSCIYVC